MIISLKYNPQNFTVRIESTQPGECWDEIKYILTAQPGVTASGMIINIKWDIFSNRLEEIINICETHRVELNPSDTDTKRFYDDAIKNREIFERGSISDSTYNKNSVKQTLKKKGFSRTLKKYQLRNVVKLVNLNAGASFSVPGAGKTTEALAFATIRMTKGYNLIVVSPKNVFSSWGDELRGCFNDDSLHFKVIETTNDETTYNTLNSGGTYFILNYEKLPDLTNILARFMTEQPCLVILDESHYIKSENSNRSMAAVSLSHLPQLKLILSGTPVPQQTEDLIPQFKFLYPEIAIQTRDVVEKLDKVFVRTTRDELGIPEAEIRKIIVPFSDNQRIIYNMLKDKIMERYNTGFRREFVKIRQYVVLLMQLVSNPSLLIERLDSIPAFPAELLMNLESNKIDRACKTARELVSKGEKVVIWSSFVKNVETIYERLIDLGARKIYGGVGYAERGEIVNNFNYQPECSIVVINPMAGSEGISLHHNCHRAIYVDRTFNVVHWLQSVDRIRRIGQKKTPIIEIFVHRRTIDDRIHDRLEEKIGRMAEILNDHSIKTEISKVVYSDEEETDYSTDIDNEDIEYIVQQIQDEEDLY